MYLDLRYPLATFVLICELLSYLLLLAMLTDHILEMKIVIPKIKNFIKNMDNFIILYFSGVSRPFTYLSIVVLVAILTLIRFKCFGLCQIQTGLTSDQIDKFATYFGFIMVFIAFAIDGIERRKTANRGLCEKCKKEI